MSLTQYKPKAKAKYIWNEILNGEIPETDDFTYLEEAIKDVFVEQLYDYFQTSRGGLFLGRLLRLPQVEHLAAILLDNNVHNWQIQRMVAANLLDIQYELAMVPKLFKDTFPREREQDGLLNQMGADKFQKEAKLHKIDGEYVVTMSRIMENVINLDVDDDKLRDLFVPELIDGPRRGRKMAITALIGKYLLEESDGYVDFTFFNYGVDGHLGYIDLQTYYFVNTIATLNADLLVAGLTEAVAVYDPDYSLRDPEEELVWTSEDGRFEAYNLKNAEALVVESLMLGHCVKDYRTELEKGSLEIYSLRTAKGKRKLTVEYRTKAKFVAQVRGKANRLVGGQPGKFHMDYPGDKFLPGEVEVAANFIHFLLGKPVSGHINSVRVNDLAPAYHHLKELVIHKKTRTPENLAAYYALFGGDKEMAEEDLKGLKDIYRRGFGPLDTDPNDLVENPDDDYVHCAFCKQDNQDRAMIEEAFGL